MGNYLGYGMFVLFASTYHIPTTTVYTLPLLIIFQSLISCRGRPAYFFRLTTTASSFVIHTNAVV